MRDRHRLFIFHQSLTAPQAGVRRSHAVTFPAPKLFSDTSTDCGAHVAAGKTAGSVSLIRITFGVAARDPVQLLLVSFPSTFTFLLHEVFVIPTALSTRKYMIGN